MYGFRLPLANINLLLNQADRQSPPYGVVNGCISSPFRPTNRPTHNGIDVAYYFLPSGTKSSPGQILGYPIYAVKSGVVIERGYDNARGYYVGINHQDANTLITRYYHMQEASLVQLNSSVEQGRQIGKVGKSGNATGAHLHFEIQPKGKDFLNPIPCLADAGSPSTAPVNSNTGEVCPYKEPMSLIQKGSEGEGVKWAQWYLKAKVAAGLAVDGYFGPLTDTAVRTFQGNKSLDVDGCVGPLTRAALACPYSEPTVNLQKGSKGDGVKWLQWYLNKKAYGLVVDGDFGLNTHNAVISFQKSRALSQDGIAGPLTRNKLKYG